MNRKLDEEKELGRKRNAFSVLEQKLLSLASILKNFHMLFVIHSEFREALNNVTSVLDREQSVELDVDTVTDLYMIAIDPDSVIHHVAMSRDPKPRHWLLLDGGENSIRQDWNMVKNLAKEVVKISNKYRVRNLCEDYL